MSVVATRNDTANKSTADTKIVEDDQSKLKDTQPNATNQSQPKPN